MPLPVIANVYRCALNWERSTQHAVNVMHIQAPSALPAADVFSTLDAFVASGMFECCVGTIQSVDITPLNGTSPTQTFVAFDDNAQWTGEASGEFVPALSALVKLQSAVRGRSHQGRLFLPFVGESKNNDGALTGTTAADMTGEWDNFANDLVGSDFAIVVASYKLETASQAVNIAVEPLLATQRRRQTRRRNS
jgi:hypothetical protein